MNMHSPVRRRGRVRRWLEVSALLAVGVAVASCGGDDDGVASDQRSIRRVGTGTVPQYEVHTQTLTLPQLKDGGTLYWDVKMQLKPDGTWTLLSTGSSREATASDQPAATLVGKEARANLQSADIDATLTVARLHAGSRVFGSVAVKLKGSGWAFANSPQETRTLHMEDFKSSAVISADESNHVVLQSHPAGGTQSVPMRLADRSYRFCMDAQAEGADTTTLVDAAGATVFTLKAGDGCVDHKAAKGDYKLEHRYGGQGAKRTVFIANEANTAAATPGVRSLQLKNAAAPPARSPTAMVSMSAGDQEREYWVIADPSNSYPGGKYMVLSGVNLGASPCWGVANFRAGGISFASMLEVKKDPLGFELGQSLGCNSGTAAGFTYYVYTGANDTYGSSYVITYDIFTSIDGGLVTLTSGYSPPLAVRNTLETKLQIVNLSGDSFQLQADRNPVYYPQRLPTPLVVGKDGILTNIDLPGTFPNDHIADTSTPLAIALRVFPDGIQKPVLGVGQVALFAGPGCSGTAIIATAPSTDLESIYSMADTIDFRGSFVRGPFQSLQVGLTTRAIVRDSGGAGTPFNQLTCQNIGAQPGDRSGFHQATLDIEVDTVTIAIRTDACELCNLAGGDFTGADLSGIKLRGANLANTLMANIDLSRADLRFTNLQGAVMSGSNLESANLCAAQLDRSATVPIAATLSRARLKNTNLALTVLNGVDFSDASFYSSGQPASCQENSCSTYSEPTCAGASGASIESANFDSAYLANVDMSGVTGRAVNFSNATLFGVSLARAKLAVNADAGTGTRFNKARLQGTIFSADTDVTYADFTGAQMDLGSTCIQAMLGASFLQVPGAKVPAGSGSPGCVAGKQTAPFCVSVAFPVSTTYPATDCTNTCADGSRTGTQNPLDRSCNAGSCAPASWTSALSSGVAGGIPTGSCQGPAQLCNAFANPPNPCW